MSIFLKFIYNMLVVSLQCIYKWTISIKHIDDIDVFFGVLLLCFEYIVRNCTIEGYLRDLGSIFLFLVQ